MTQFVMEELHELSESGVYRTLELRKLVSAQSQSGVFHDNIFLKLVLQSPYLNKQSPYSVHDVMVMRDKEDGVLSFAIDEFPDMEPDAIERFWIRTVEEQRANRDATFAQLVDDYQCLYCDADADKASASSGSSGSSSGSTGSANSAHAEL